MELLRWLPVILVVGISTFTLIAIRIKFIKAYGRCGFISYHDHYKPLVSRYVSFNTRDIIYECKCGKRISNRCYRNTGFFPIPTDSIDSKTFKAILEGADFERQGLFITLKENK